MTAMRMLSLQFACCNSSACRQGQMPSHAKNRSPWLRDPSANAFSQDRPFFEKPGPPRADKTQIHHTTNSSDLVDINDVGWIETAGRGECDEVDDEQRQASDTARRLHHGDRPSYRRLAASGLRGRCRAQYRPLSRAGADGRARHVRPGVRRRQSRPAGMATAIPRSRSRVSHSAHFEPVTLWSALSQVTEQDRLRRHRLDHLRGSRTCWPASSPRSTTSRRAARPGTS